jgi:hypothetical protein
MLFTGCVHIALYVAQTLSSNHMLENTGQTIDLVFTENFTCLLPCAMVTGARDGPQGRF